MDVLVIIPESVSYFYEIPGHRLRDALQNLGYTVVVARLDNFPVQPYTWCFVVNLADVIQGFLRTERGNLDDAIRQISQMQAYTRYQAVILMECLRTTWYEDNYQWAAGLQLHHMIDLGFHHQRHYLHPERAEGYHFLFNGLTTQERRHLHDLSAEKYERPVPWTFIGTYSRARAQVIQQLIEEVDTGGMVYMRNPQGEAVGWSGPHINYQDYLRIHQHTRYSIWCSHHQAFYLESERFRMAALAGAVPIKVTLPQQEQVAVQAPFDHLVVASADLPQRLQALPYDETWYQFRDAYLLLPPLEDEICRTMERIEHAQ